MNFQRLKFAWARGARIEWFNPIYKTWKFSSNPAWNATERYRIHPNDAHLEYGPLSSALRTWVLDRREDGTDLDAAEMYYTDILALPAFAAPPKPDDRLMFALFVAELLADEGL